MPHLPRLTLTPTLSRAAHFQYKAVDKTGQPARGGLDAVNEVDLELRLRRMGLDLITVQARSTARRRRLSPAATSRART